MVRRSETNLKILRYIQLQAPASVPEISKACKIKPHAVNYALKQLREEKLLTLRPLVNHSRLGFTEYELYLRLPVSAAESRARLLRWAADSPNVTVLCEVGGEFQYEVVFITRSVSDLLSTFTSFSAYIGDIALERSMAVRTSVRMFGTKCLYAIGDALPNLGYTCGAPIEEVSALDHRILRGLDGQTEFNLSKLARELGEAASTVEYRLRRLEEREILAGYFYDYSGLNDVLGLLGFHLLIRLKGVVTAIEEDFVRFCHAHPHIDNLQGGIGNWDLKLLARVPSYDAVLRLVDELFARFEKRVADVRIVPMLKVHRVCGFPEPLSSVERPEALPAARVRAKV